MSSPSNSAALILFNAHPCMTRVKRSEERDPDKRWALTLKGFTLSPGRTLDRVYTVSGHALEKQANRVAHKMGMGSLAAAQKLEVYFGDGEQRLLKLEGLRSCTPPKVRDYCANLVKYTLPTQAPITRLHAFRNLVHLCTRFPGLRAIFLGCKAMRGVTSAASISELWESDPLAAPSKEWSFWQGLAVACWCETTISPLLDDTPVAELTYCPEEGLSVIEQLLVEWESSADSKLSAALCVRYLGGILNLPGFWTEISAMHSLVAKKLCRGMVRALKDVGVDILQLGSFDDDEPPFDYDGIDFLAATMLIALASWFGKFGQQEQTEQLWYDSLRELLQLLRAPRSADLLPQASASAIDIWGALLPLHFQSVVLDVTARCEDGNGPSSGNTLSDWSPPLASITGIIVEDNLNDNDNSVLSGDKEWVPNPSPKDSGLATPLEVNDGPADGFEINLTPDHAEQPEMRENSVDAREGLGVESVPTLDHPEHGKTQEDSVDAPEDMEINDGLSVGNIVIDSGSQLASALLDDNVNNNDNSVPSHNEESVSYPSTPEDPSPANPLELNNRLEDGLMIDLTPDHAEQLETRENSLDPQEDLGVESVPTLDHPEHGKTQEDSVDAPEDMGHMADDEGFSIGNTVFDSGTQLAKTLLTFLKNHNQRVHHSTAKPQAHNRPVEELEFTNSTPVHVEQPETREDSVDAQAALAVVIDPTLNHLENEETREDPEDAQEDVVSDRHRQDGDRSSTGNTPFASDTPLARVTGAAPEDNLSDSDNSVGPNSEELTPNPLTQADPTSASAPHLPDIPHPSLNLLFALLAAAAVSAWQPPMPPRALYYPPDIPLPQPDIPFAPWIPTQDIFPIDLTDPVDFHRLERAIDNVSISEHTTVYIYPSSRDRCLLQVPTQGRHLTTFSFIQYLQTMMRKPLTPHDFTTLLSTAAQQEVYHHFLARSRKGKQLWDGFTRGVRAARGPKGVILLQGHHYLWGFSQDQHGQWIMDVDVPTPQEAPQSHRFHTLYFSSQ